MAEQRKSLESPSQTAGPYLHIGCAPSLEAISQFGADLGANLKMGPVRGQEIVLRGRVFDGAGEPVLDAMIEIWQADASGVYRTDMTGAEPDPGFRGWGRCMCDFETGAYSFDTIKPGAVPWPDGRMQAPHILIWIAARGINLALQTRVYFPDEPDANAADSVLREVAKAGREATLIARAEAEDTYVFDIHLQGQSETVFLDV